MAKTIGYTLIFIGLVIIAPNRGIGDIPQELFGVNLLLVGGPIVLLGLVFVYFSKRMG